MFRSRKPGKNIMPNRLIPVSIFILIPLLIAGEASKLDAILIQVILLK